MLLRVRYDGGESHAFKPAALVPEADNGTVLGRTVSDFRGIVDMK